MSNLNATIKLLVQVFEPYSYNCSVPSGLLRSRHCIYPGIMPEYTGSVLRAAGIRYETVFLNEGWDEALYAQAIQNDTYSCSIPWFTKTPINEEVLQLSEPVVCENLLAAYSTEQVNELFGFMAIFSWQVWLSACAALGLIRLLVWVFGMVKARYPADQCIDRSFSAAQNRIFLWSAFFTIFVSLYENGLLSKLLVPQTHRPFTDLASVAAAVASGQLKYISFKDSIPEQEINTDPALASLRRALTLNPPISVLDPVDGVTLAAKYANHIYAEYNIFMWYEVAKRSNLTLIPLVEFHDVCWRIACNKQLPPRYVRSINKAIVEQNSHLKGIFTRYEKYSEYLQERRIDRNMKLSQIGLNETLGLWTILAVGFVGAVLSVFVESTWNIWKTLIEAFETLSLMTSKKSYNI